MINLLECTFHISGISDNPEKSAHAQKICKDLGLKPRVLEIPPIPGDTSSTVDAISQLKALQFSGFSTPLLIINNDCEPTEHFETRVSIPEGTDILYVGGENAGYVEHLGGAKVVGAAINIGVDDALVRVWNMSGSHAVLYLSKRAIQAAIDSMILALIHRRHHDFFLSKLQTTLHVYATRKPLFYKSSRFNKTSYAMHEEKLTTHVRASDAPPSKLVLKSKNHKQATLGLMRRPNGQLFWKALQI